MSLTAAWRSNDARRFRVTATRAAGVVVARIVADASFVVGTSLITSAVGFDDWTSNTPVPRRGSSCDGFSWIRHVVVCLHVELVPLRLIEFDRTCQTVEIRGRLNMTTFRQFIVITTSLRGENRKKKKQKRVFLLKNVEK